MLQDLQTPRILLAELSVKNHSSINLGALNRYHIENYFLRITTYKDLTVHFIEIKKGWPLDKNNSAASKLLKLAKAVGARQTINFLPHVDVLLAAKTICNKVAHQGNSDMPDTILINLYHDLKTFLIELPPNINVRDVELEP